MTQVRTALVDSSGEVVTMIQANDAGFVNIPTIAGTIVVPEVPEVVSPYGSHKYNTSAGTWLLA